MLSSAFLLFVFSHYAVPLQVVRLWALMGCKPTIHRTLQVGDNKFLLALCAAALTEVVFAQCPSEVLLAGRECGKPRVISVRLHGFLGITGKGDRAGAQTCVTVFSCSESINTAAACFCLQQRRGRLWNHTYHTLKQFMDQNFLLCLGIALL